MTNLPQDSSAYLSVQRSRTWCGRRSLVVFATTAVAGLAAAGPALATEIPEPTPIPVVVPDVPPVPDPTELPTIPIPELPPEVVEPPVVVIDIDAENIDVSIRVLSPGEDKTQEAQQQVVSPEPKPDITATADPPAAAAENIVEEIVEDADPAPIVGAVNTNISIRVLSPGDNEAVSQGTATPERKSAPEAESPTGANSREPSQAASLTSDGSQDSERYQDDNSQYQSADQIANDPWNWRWLLTVDCAGNANSSSTDSGDPASLEWSWEWIWEWGCGDEVDDSAPVPTQGTTSGLSPPGTASNGPTGGPTGNETASSPGPAGAGSSAPWNWTWSFTFCGKTTTFTTSAGQGTPLTWAWDWLWDWTCPNTALDQAPAEGPSTPPAPGELPPLMTSPPTADGADDSFGVGPVVIGPVAIDLPAWVATLPTGISTGITTLQHPSWPTAVGITLELAIPPAIPQAGPWATVPVPPETPTEASRSATPSAAAPVPARPPSRALNVLPPLPPASSQETAPRSRSGNGARPAHKSHEEQPRVTRAPLVSLPSIPSVPRSRPGLGSSSAGSVGTSALLVGVAALTGFVLLAAPGLGRRIRVARELSPGSPDSPPIDHPG